jgi:pantoate--beta-alanine ligase
MFPEPILTRVAVGGLSEGREGAARPGHLTGVATVVAKLFAICGPCRAYFGEKDHQQLTVVRRMVHDLSFPVEVVACPTVREPDGLALSSRNVRLSPEEREAAPVLYRALLAGRALVEAGERDAGRVGRAMAEEVAGQPLARLDYAEAGEEEDGWRLFVAARFGRTRLVDNLAVELAPGPGCG